MLVVKGCRALLCLRWSSSSSVGAARGLSSISAAASVTAPAGRSMLARSQLHLIGRPATALLGAAQPMRFASTGATDNEAAVADVTPALSSTSGNDASSLASLATNDTFLDKFAAQAIEGTGAYIGELQTVGLASLSTPSGWVQNLLEFMAAQPGMSWFSGIIASTLLVRTVMLPVVVSTTRNTVKLANIQPEAQLHANRMKECRAIGDEEGQRLATTRLKEVYEKNGTNPLKALLGLAQIPVFLSFFFALRGITDSSLDSLKTGGFYFFTDLSATDPTYVLPVLTASTMFISLELNSRVGAPMNPMMKNVMRGLSLVTGVVTSFLPMGIHLYWITSNVFTMCQVVVINSGPFKKMLNIPERVQHAPVNKEGEGGLSGFIQSFKDGMDGARKQQEHEEKLKAQREQFLRMREQQEATTAAASQAPTLLSSASSTAASGNAGRKNSSGKSKAKRGSRRRR